jgi:hypothetical protein
MSGGSMRYVGSVTLFSSAGGAIALLAPPSRQSAPPVAAMCAWPVVAGADSTIPKFLVARHPQHRVPQSTAVVAIKGLFQTGAIMTAGIPVGQSLRRHCIRENRHTPQRTLSKNGLPIPKGKRSGILG